MKSRLRDDKELKKVVDKIIAAAEKSKNHA